MITATLSGEEPAPQEICYPILMKDTLDGQIVIALGKKGGLYKILALSMPTRGYLTTQIEEADVDHMEVYHGEITLKNA